MSDWVVVRSRADKRTVRGWWIVDVSVFDSEDEAEAYVEKEVEKNRLYRNATRRADNFDIQKARVNV